MARFVAILFVWFGCTAAWMILGSTVLVRSGESTYELEREVQALWGAPLTQLPPTLTFTPSGSLPPPVEPAPDPVLDSTSIDASLALEHRKKGLLWFPTYTVGFAATYVVRNAAEVPGTVSVSFPLQAENAFYDGFEVRRGDGAAVPATVAGAHAAWSDALQPGERKTYVVHYRSRGTTSWQYQPTAGTGQVRAFRLALDTDFANVDFPAASLSPSQHEVVGEGWHGVWEFKTLVASSPVGVVLPQLLNPGPLAAKITFFAPVSLLFFFFVVAILGEAYAREIHPMNYFFVGCAFFAFHLLFSYLLDHIAVTRAFALSSVVSLALVVSYARLFVGWRFAVLAMGSAQLVYLVLFSFTFFWAGFTGLAVTVGAIVTLALMMQLTGRRRWGAPSAPPPVPAPLTGPAGA